jgi:hypothetical protein
MTNLQRRLRKLETRSDPRGPLRLVVRYPDEEPESGFDENEPNTFVVVVEYVDMPSKAPLGPTR